MAQTSNTMLATLAFTSASVLKAPLALRGGMTIAGVEPEQVATGLNALLAVQGLMMTQNQGKIHEVYGVKPTPITELFTENGGGILVGFAIAATLVLGGTDAAEAVGYGNIPNLLQNIKDFVGGTADKNGWGAPAKFVPLVVNAAFCAALLGKVDAWRSVVLDLMSSAPRFIVPPCSVEQVFKPACERLLFVLRLLCSCLRRLSNRLRDLEVSAVVARVRAQGEGRVAGHG